ncbi:MAG: hypothetical protein WKF77_10830 [Planctomycetaceae bacterium]
MKRNFIVFAFSLFLGCGSDSSMLPVATPVQNWTLKVDHFIQDHESSELCATVRSTQPCQLIIAEPHSGIHRSLLLVADPDGGYSSKIRWSKQIVRQNPTGTIHLNTSCVTESAGSKWETGPSSVALGEDAPVLSEYQTVIPQTNIGHPFGCTIALVQNNDENVTIVSVTTALNIQN